MTLNIKHNIWALAMTFAVASCSTDEITEYFPTAEYLSTNSEVMLNSTSPSELKVKATGKWNLTVSDNSWIQVSETQGEGETIVRVSAANDNPDPDNERTGSITIRTQNDGLTQTVQVRQYSGNETFKVGSDTMLIVGRERQVINVPVQCNTTWDVSGGQDWCTISRSGSTAVITLSENHSEYSRSTKFIFVSAHGDIVQLTIVQAATEIIKEEQIFSVTETNNRVDRRGGEVRLRVTGNVSWTAYSTQDWASISETQGRGDGEIFIYVPENPTLQERTAEVRFEYTLDGERRTSICTITQEAGRAPDEWDNESPQ